MRTEKKYKSLSKRVILGVVISLALVVAVSLFIMTKIISSGLEDYFQSQMEQKVEILDHKFKKLENDVINAAKLAAKNFGGGDWDHYLEDLDLMQVQVEDIVGIYDTVDCVVVLDRYGKFEYARKDKINFTVTEVLVRLVQNAEPHFTRFKRGSDTIQLCTYPIFDEDNNFCGTCFVSGILNKQSIVDDILNVL